MWEYWGKELKQHSIAQKRSDLFLPAINIQAVAFILSQIISRSARNNKLEMWNITDTIVKHYYGVDSKEYKRKLLLYTSDLWMKRMSIVILKEYKNIKQDSVKIKGKE